MSPEVVSYKLGLFFPSMIVSFRRMKGRIWCDNIMAFSGVILGLISIGFPGMNFDVIHLPILFLSDTSFSWLEEVPWPWLPWVHLLSLFLSLLSAPWFWSLLLAHRKSTGKLSSFRWAGRPCVTWVCTTLSIICKRLLPQGKVPCSFDCAELTWDLLVP